jgi:membrane-bound serine protease (ClpP class)
MNLSALLEASPDAALLSLFAGVLLIYFECNRPGSIIPGCAGVLLALLSIDAFAHMPLRPLALALVAAGIVLILAELKVSARNLAAATGTALLIFGFRNLLQPFAPARVHTPTAIVAAAGFAASTLWLARIALRARHNKRSLSPVPGFPAASERRTG